MHPPRRMKITLLTDESIRLENDGGPLTVEAMTAEQAYSPFHMVASGLALCTLNVLHSWATHAKLDADKLAIEVGWSFADGPHRIGEFHMRFDWPGLPESRREAARRAATLCPVHATFAHAPTITVEVS